MTLFEYLQGEIQLPKDSTSPPETVLAAAQLVLEQNPPVTVQYEREGLYLQLRDGTKVLLPGSGAEAVPDSGVAVSYTAAAEKARGTRQPDVSIPY